MPTFDQSALERELTRDEGVRFTIYVDTTGNPTVGIGHNLNAGPLPNQTYPMTQAQVDALFASDVASTVAKLDTYLPWWRTLDDVRQRVLINMAFNLGIGRPGAGTGLLGFPNTLALIKGGDYSSAAAAMLKSLWARQVGARANRLAAMMETGTAAAPQMAPFPPTPLPTSKPIPFPPLPKPIPNVPPVPVRPIANGAWAELGRLFVEIISAITAYLQRKPK
jgi:lysozyme